MPNLAKLVDQVIATLAANTDCVSINISAVATTSIRAYSGKKFLTISFYPRKDNCTVAITYDSTRHYKVDLNSLIPWITGKSSLKLSSKSQWNSGSELPTFKQSLSE